MSRSVVENNFPLRCKENLHLGAREKIFLSMPINGKKQKFDCKGVRKRKIGRGFLAPGGRDGITLEFLKNLPRNPTRPPFFKGRRAFWGFDGRFHFFPLLEKGSCEKIQIEGGKSLSRCPGEE
jgi:hypothetical protein